MTTKTIGTCKDCRYWKRAEPTSCRGYCSNTTHFATGESFGCVHWKSRKPNCEKCRYFDGGSFPDPDLGRCRKMPGEIVSTSHWCQMFAGFFAEEIKDAPIRPNYPIRTPDEMRIEDLQREADAAAERIGRLSKALLTLGYDPTQI